MAYKLAEEDKLCGVIYPTYEGFSPIPKVTCDMLESKCDQTIIVKCGDKTEEDKKDPESQSGSASASVSESTSMSTSTSESTSDSASQSESKSESTSNSVSSSESTSVSDSASVSESTSYSVSASQSTSDSTSQSMSTSTSESVSTSESTTSISNSQSESNLVSTSESKSESISASGSTSLSNSTSTSNSVTTSLSTTEALSESELASASLSELSSEEFIAHSNEINTINDNLREATGILNTMIYGNIFVRRGNPYTPMYLKETVLNYLAIDASVNDVTKMYLSEYMKVNDVHIDPKYKMDSEHEPQRVPLVFDITLPWGGKRTLVVPTNVIYMDEDIEKPEPNPYIEGHTPAEPTPAETDKILMDKRAVRLADKLKDFNYTYGIVSIDGDKITIIRDKDGRDVTKDTFNSYVNTPEFISNLENYLNNGATDEYKLKVTEVNGFINATVGSFYPGDNSIFSVGIHVQYPDGDRDSQVIYLHSTHIDTL